MVVLHIILKISRIIMAQYAYLEPKKLMDSDHEILNRECFTPEQIFPDAKLESHFSPEQNL